MPKTLLPTLFIFLASIVANSSYADSESVKYTINIDQATHHMAKVMATFPAPTGKELTVQLPVWRTGRYAILNMSSGLREFSAKDSKGNRLKWRMTDKSAWTIESNGKPITVSYRMYANELGYRTKHIDDSHAFLDASAVFVYNPQMRNNPITVELKVPRKWRSRSGLISTGKHKFKAANYDQLIDSPIETGVHTFDEFAVEDRDYELLFWGEGNYDREKTIADLKKLDKQMGLVWGDYPYTRYLYMVHATSGARGATEHINSTIIQRARNSFKSRDDYKGFISTAAHELIHTWNVKAYRPAGLVPYDYQKENYTTLLWVAEGTTSYYDGLLPRRADIITQKEFHKDLASSIEFYYNRPGRKVQSVSESSFYGWISANRDFTLNHSVNIYSKGSLVSWLIDFKIRELTNNEKSLDDVHRLLYQRFNAKEKGYTDADLLNIVEEVSGQQLDQFWQDYVWGTKEIDFEKVLDQVGLKLEFPADDKVKIDLGLQIDSSNKVTRVVKDSDAWQAGLTTDDYLVAIDGMRVTKSNMAKILEKLAVGEKVTLHYFRRDALKSTKIKPSKNKYRKLKVVVNKDATDQQRDAYEAWTKFPLSKVKPMGVDDAKDAVSKASAYVQ
ncbi:MAG: PDZ domain-containing protein [Kangiellaceae bacterium]|jgi:predicted metalloprotease with PDZ domain|nr:PDZ domain-containing protein [Kangiellaceae bacterium]